MEIVAGVILLIVVALLVVGCKSQPVESYVPLYTEADATESDDITQNYKSKRELDDLFSNLKLLFSDLKHPDLQQRIGSTYAEEIYFNDTFRTLKSREQLVDYLQETAARVKSTTTEFKEYAQGGSSYYVRWTMHIEFDVQGKTIVTDSIGISQIRFDDAGLIRFHQDFWDNTEGFFQHLPFVGYMVGKVKTRL